MSMNEPEPTKEPEVMDSGVHVRDSERDIASTPQIALTVLAIVGILGVVFWGLNHQRTEVAGSEATQATTAAAANGDTSGTQPTPQNQTERQQQQKEANQQQGKSAPQSNAPETTGQAVGGPTAPPAPDNNAQPENQRPSGGVNGNAEPPSNQQMQPRGAGK